MLGVTFYRWWRVLPLLALVAVLGVSLVACGEGDAGNGSAGGGKTGFSTEVFDNQVRVTADPKGALKWDQATYQAQAGNVTFVVTNTSPTPHNFAVQGNGINAVSKNFRGQNAQFLSLPNLAPGDYMIVCTVPGHREAGMVAKLVVK
jgi:plastocyanin